MQSQKLNIFKNETIFQFLSKPSMKQIKDQMPFLLKKRCSLDKLFFLQLNPFIYSTLVFNIYCEREAPI